MKYLDVPCAIAMLAHGEYHDPGSQGDFARLCAVRRVSKRFIACFVADRGIRETCTTNGMCEMFGAGGNKHAPNRVTFSLTEKTGAIRSTSRREKYTTCIVRPISVPAPALKLLLPRTYEVRVFLLLRSVVLIVLLLYTPEFANYSDYSTILNLINLVLGS